MDKQIIIFKDIDFILGGEESYFIRMSQWALQQGIVFSIAVNEGSSIDNIWDEEIRNNKIRVYRYDFKFTGGLVFVDDEDEIFGNKETMIISSRIHLTTQLYAWKKKTTYNARIIQYVLHPYQSFVSRRKWLNKPFERFIREKIGNNIVFMDQQTKKACDDYYGFDFDVKEYYRLGCFAGEFNRELVIEKYNKKEKIILCMSRLDFPFKGFMLGMIDEAKALLNQHKNIKFIFVGDGDGKNDFERRLIELKQEFESAVEWIPKIKYEELQSIFEKVYLFIGMGTSILDAAKYCTPSIVMYAYTNKAIPLGYWADNPENIGEEYKGDSSDKNVISMIDKYIELSLCEYIEKCEYLHEKYCDMYDIDKIMNKIMQIQYQGRTPSIVLCMLDNIIYKIQKYGMFKIKSKK